MSQSSLVYRNAAVYELVMRVLYGRHYAARMQAIAGEVPDGASVLELCCGPGTLYLRHLRGRTSRYVGLDLNARFVTRLRERGVDARLLDLSASGAPLPDAQIAIMQASLYHFLPDPGPVIERMLAAASEKVIISEPVRNLASSEIPIVRLLGQRATDPGVGEHAQRFTEQTLARVMDRYRSRTIKTFAIPGGRERVYVLARDR